MSYVLSFPLNIATETGHYGKPKGTAGRAGQPIIGICLHVLELTVESYLAYLRSPLALTDVRPGTHGSMNYLVAADGTLFLTVAETNTAWGIQELNDPTWDLLNDHVGVDPDSLLLHIGVEKTVVPDMPRLMFRGLADLITYLCVKHDIPIDDSHIIDHSQLDTVYADCANALATNLIATVTSLAAQGNQGVSLDVSVIAAQLAALTTRVTTLETNVAASLATIATFANHVTTKAGATTLGHVESSSTVSVNASTGVAATIQNAASYKVDPTAAQTIVAGIQAIVQFPTVISDAISWATLGAFQKFTPTVAGLYRLRARVQFAISDWTAGKYIQLDVFKNGVLLETIAYKGIEANLTSKIVSLAGESAFVVTLTDYFDVRLITDDANGSKSIAGGSVSIEKVGA